VKTVGSSNSKPFWDAGSANKFEVLIRLTSTDARMRPGLTAGVYINSDPRKNVLYVPRQALFLKDNKRVVYVRRGDSNFYPHEVSIQAENESRAAVGGLSAGTEIALVDPTSSRNAANARAASPAKGAP
jgi:hypothetical protein